MKMLKNETTINRVNVELDEVMNNRIRNRDVYVGLTYLNTKEGCLLSYMSKVDDNYILKYEYHDTNISPADFLDLIEYYEPASLKITTNNPRIYSDLNYYEENIKLFNTVEMLDENFNKFREFASKKRVIIINNVDDERSSKKFRMLSLCYGQVKEEHKYEI